jgi:amidophosphoribosyltransferase
VRYPTVGSGGARTRSRSRSTIPFGIVMAHNGNVANYDELKDELAAAGSRHLFSGCDVEVVLNVFASRPGAAAADRFTPAAYEAAVREVHLRVRGAYSVVGFIAGHGLFAFRDPYGIKPIAVGRKRIAPNGGPGPEYAHAVASKASCSRRSATS